MKNPGAEKLMDGLKSKEIFSNYILKESLRTKLSRIALRCCKLYYPTQSEGQDNSSLAFQENKTEPQTHLNELFPEGIGFHYNQNQSMSHLRLVYNIRYNILLSSNASGQPKTYLFVIVLRKHFSRHQYLFLLPRHMFSSPLFAKAISLQF